MSDLTPDICDKYEDKVTLLSLPLSNFGQRDAFWGQVVTVRCYQDNSKVRETLQQEGKGKVLVVDGNGSCAYALLGDQLAMMAAENHWEGIIINGAVRDVAMLSQIDIGVKAIGTCPFKTEKKGAGEQQVSLCINRQLIQPGQYVYADWNGVLISDHLLEV
ncbi:putative 4-hydroxy-4-methyl-2-oxoglutarate aldolase [Vibrio hippocampi]|uniref:4-hydroxy-4-methyl-2-oxoglutarate aldolase n=1 Tax=Vibrio hippocampi TaxID=654686 RepID=A0ABM8ZJL1_9VIBR|nr:putative 4-hydroxy-4-methyl-2-oxoglutarate aldolase [Vibrio hippocampi]CAH0527051.1 Putative 4-hydroxy-4-methyl-2-oxoglutarate aldolase [Vibrio hippocampi]